MYFGGTEREENIVRAPEKMETVQKKTSKETEPITETGRITEEIVMKEESIKFDSEIIGWAFADVNPNSSKPAVEVVETYAAFSELCGEYGIPEKLSRFDEKYFETGVLVLIQTVPGSGSIRHEVDGIVRGENELTVCISRSIGPIHTMDLTVYTAAVGIDRDDFRGLKVTCNMGEIIPTE